MNKVDLRVDWCSYEAAKFAVEHWHYSRCVPNQKTVKIGIWENSVFIGCILFGDGANAGMFKPYGLRYDEGCELVRVALSSHVTPVSRLISISLRFLKNKCPGIRLVISFADPEHNHIGSIYQAGNWYYTGMTAAADEYIVRGVKMHGRALRSTRSTHRRGGIDAENILDWARQILDPDIQSVSGSSKHRYLYPLDAAMRAQIEPLRKPYPKRATEPIEDGTGDQPEQGGASPTRSLATL